MSRRRRARTVDEPRPLTTSGGGPPAMAPALLRVGVGLFVVYAAIGIGLGWWGVVEAGRLTADAGNPLVLAAREAPRGEIVDARGVVLAESVKDGAGWLCPALSASRSRAADRLPEPTLRGVRVGAELRAGAAGHRQRHGRRPAAQAHGATRTTNATSSCPWTCDCSGGRCGSCAGSAAPSSPSSPRPVASWPWPARRPTTPTPIVDPKTGAAYFQALLDRPEDDSALLDRATRGRLHARLGAQDGDRGRRPRQRCHHAFDGLSGPAGRGEDGHAGRGLHASMTATTRRPATRLSP